MALRVRSTDAQRRHHPAGGSSRSLGNALSLGSFTVGGALDLDFSGAATLTGNRVLTINNTGLTTFSNAIGEDIAGRSPTKNGPGTLRFSGANANTFSGNMNVNAGTLELAKTPGVNAIASGFLNIGDNIGGPGADVVRLLASNQIADTTPVSIFSTGAFDLNGNSETIATLEIHDGSLTTGAGTLTLGTGGITTSSATSGTATISGNLNLGAATRAINVGDGAAAIELTSPPRLPMAALIRLAPAPCNSAEAPTTPIPA